MLHVYRASIHTQLRRSLAHRLAFQREVEIAGVPKLHVVNDDGDLIWILEDLIPGSPPNPDHRDDWLPMAVDWLCELAAVEGPTLRTTPFWQDHWHEAIEVTPADLRPEVSRAWEIVGDMRARPLHGDVQPKNLVLAGTGVGLVDWEGFYGAGLPGLDIMFLATMSGPSIPGPIVLDLILDRAGLYDSLLRSALHRSGYRGQTVDAGLKVMLSLWSLGEVRRQRRRGAVLEQTPFSDLLVKIPKTDM
jgi:hypothetical protein